MKVAIVLLCIFGLSVSAYQPMKIFHEHVEDFLDLIVDEVGDDIRYLVHHYFDFEEFRKSMGYMTTANFKEVVYEMESLPEFKAVVDFFEKDNIDIMYFIDRLNQIIEDLQGANNIRKRHTLSGKNMTAYINDCIAVFPKDKLTALYEQKIAEDEEFKVAIENLKSDEWNQIWDALWANKTFLNEAQTLYDHGIDLQVLLSELKAVFGQF